MAAGEGLLVTSDDVVLRDFAVEDTRGDGIKSKGADRIVYKNIRVEWTGGAKETNGAYGVYPVESHDVLIDGVTVRGASDAGIYVGQSENIIVRGSVAEYNVAGIEIENSRRADVYGNTARHNAGGILVFDLPNLPIIGGGQVRVFANMVTVLDMTSRKPPLTAMKLSLPSFVTRISPGCKTVRRGACRGNMPSSPSMPGATKMSTSSEYTSLSAVTISNFIGAIDKSSAGYDVPGYAVACIFSAFSTASSMVPTM